MSRLPTPDDISAFITESPTPVTRREIARAFNLKNEDRIFLKAALRELEKAGRIEKNGGKSYKTPQGLPAATVVEIIEVTFDGEIIAEPVEWRDKGDMPRVSVITKSDAQIGVGDRALVRLKRLEKHAYEGRIIHILGGVKDTIVGTFSPDDRGGGIVYPADKSIRYDFYIRPQDTEGAGEGDLVSAEIRGDKTGTDKNRKQARITQVLGREDDPKMISLIAILHHSIPYEFPDAVIRAAEKFDTPELGKRRDLRQIPLVTIDGADARDFDDAVFAEPDSDPENRGGWHLIVAIADVSFYVTPDSALDREAYTRGNSTYFPDRVVPMLPEALSNNICSLRPHEPRACMAAHMWIDENGHLLRYKFIRGLMQSHARLTYEQVQQARDGKPDPDILPLMPQIDHLYGAFRTLFAARKQRGALDLDLPERKAVIDDSGHITAIVSRERLDSHMLIEEFMVLTNVAAAMALEEKNAPCVYRVHDKPDSTKIDAAADFLASFDIRLDKGAVMTPKRMNRILDIAKEKDTTELVSMIVLRAQSQAVYSPDNLGHFGLALEKYAHFTSPIRRYADLLVHRAMVEALRLPGGGGMNREDSGLLSQQAQHISETERRSMIAERDAMDRYTALFLQDRIGNSFEGRIAGLNKAGLFVRLNDSGADGLIPIRSLPDDYYIHNEAYHCLIGRNHGRCYRLMAPVTIKLKEADPILGSMLFELLDYHASLDPPKAIGNRKQRTRRPKKDGKIKKKRTTPKHKRTHKRKGKKK